MTSPQVSVLVVEDDPGIATQLVRGLERAGYTADSVAMGAEALRRAPSDVVLLDLGLPDVDGIDVCRRLRADSDTAIIVVTARGEEADRVLALDEGADDYLVKPFGLAELLARIRAVLRRGQRAGNGGAAEVLRHGPLTVDLRTRKVTMTGSDVALTPKEFAILECLATDPGRLISRQEIVERAWDEHWYGPTKVLDVHLAALRRKLGDPSLIETVYGHGFRLADRPVPSAELAMTRRVAAALLALTLAILVAAVVPLALGAIAHERDSFVQDTARTAASIAGIAEARLGDHVTDDHALSAALVTAARQGDELLLLNSHGHVVVSQGAPLDSAWHQLVAQSTLQNDPTTELTSSRVIAVQTVWDDGKLSGTAIGTVVLERPTGPLNQNIAHLWLYLVGLSGAAMAAAVLIAFLFARWVSRPLARLDTAARTIADGNLAVRAKTGYGPPELRRMAATFNMMAGRLEALVHGHRAMLADASHQLRTPLTALRLRLDLLAADSGPAAAAELAGAQEEIARLSRLVDGLLATARAEAVTEQLEQIDVACTVSERVAAWQPVADGNGVKLLAEAPTAPVPPVALGAGHLEQILDNLLDNAIEAIGDGDGTVRVSVARSAAGTVLTVADDGPGMTAQERSRAFLRYTTGSQNGTGLGLAIVHRLVTANGGTIRLADTPGGGLTVEVDLPSPDEP